MTRLFSFYLDLVTRRPRSVLAVLALLTLFLAMGLPRFKLDASADSLTLEHDRSLDFYRQEMDTYSTGDFLVVTFKPKKDLFSDDSLHLLQQLKSDLSKVDGVESIHSILDVPLLFSPKLSLTQVAGKPRTLLDPDVDRAMAKKEFLTSPIYKKLLLGPDGQTTALQLNLQVDRKYIELVKKRDELRRKQNQGELSEQGEKELQQVSDEFTAYRTQTEARSRARVQQVRDIVAAYRDRAQIFVGGISMIAADMISFIQSDLIVFGSAVIFFMIVVLAIIFRSVTFVAIPMLCCIVSVVMMLGYVSWLDWRLTVISSNFVALLLIVTLSIIIHLIVRYREFLQSNPDWSREQRVRETVKFMALPCFYTSITTIVAFASLVVSDIRPVIDFGWMMTMGLAVALTLSFLILPAALVLLPEGRAAQAEKEKVEDKPLTLKFSSVVERFGRTVLVVAAIVAALAIWGVTRLKVENRFIDYFHSTTEIYRGLSVIDKDLGGTISLDILIDAPKKPAQDKTDPFSDSDGFAKDSDFGGGDDFADDDPFSESETNSSYWMTLGGLQKIQWLQDYLESQPEIGKVQSLAILYEVGKDINGSLNDFELVLLQKSLSREVRSVLISPYLSPDGKQARVTMRIRDGYPGLKRVELVARIKKAIAESGQFEDGQTHFTGLLILYNNMLQSLFSSQILTLGVVFLAIYVMLAILFKSIYTASVAIIPTALAALSVLGAMGIFGLPLDMMTITVASITVGIGVDNTIHYIHRFKTELALDGDYIGAMHRSHASIGRAMYYTSVIIIFGFGIMTLSNFMPTIYFGLLTGFAMFASLAGSLFLLPKLILLFKPVKPAMKKE